MDKLTRQAVKNGARLARIALTRNEPISPEEILRELRKPLPDPRDIEGDAFILADWDHWVTFAGIKGGRGVVSYEEAAKLSGKSEAALRQAAHRKKLLSTTEYRRGRKRTGVYFYSLASYCGWTLAEWRKADRRIDKRRRREANWERE